VTPPAPSGRAGYAHAVTASKGGALGLLTLAALLVGKAVLVVDNLPFMRRFDFDPEAVVRMCWLGVRPLNKPAPVRYFRPDEGGVSHFRYWRDNALLTWMHLRLFLGFVLRLPGLVIRRLRAS